MIKIDKQEYYKVIQPLSRVSFNNLFARAVIEKRVSGSVYVNNTKNPETLYIVHPYGMSLLLGEHNNKEFNEWFKNYVLNKDNIRKKDDLMQAFPGDWNNALNDLLEELISSKKVEINTRVNFRFNIDKYMEIKNKLQPEKYIIKPSAKSIYSEMKGNVVPQNFWDNEDDFYNNGIGFSLYIDEKLTTTAFSAFIHDNKFELGMETREEFRGRGYAQITCSKLIDYCIENNYEPIWACSLENSGSYRLAEKLGFDADITIPYYILLK